MEWQASEVITLVAILVGPVGAVLTAWYAANRQDKAAKRQDLRTRRENVEEALAEAHRVRASVGDAAGVGGMAHRMEKGQLLELADGAVAKLSYAYARHPHSDVRQALDGLVMSLNQVSARAEAVEHGRNEYPEDPGLETAQRAFHSSLESLIEQLGAAEQALHDYHADQDA